MALQELLGLASFMTGASMPEVMTHFTEAFQRFSPQERDPSKSGIRYATRAMLFLAQYASLHGQWSEAHQALMRAHLQVCLRLLLPFGLSLIYLLQTTSLMGLASFPRCQLVQVVCVAGLVGVMWKIGMIHRRGHLMTMPDMSSLKGEWASIN